MPDEIKSDAGDNAEDVVTGKGNQQSRQQANPRQRQNNEQRNDPSQNMYFNQPEGGQNWVISQILDHGQQIRELAYRIDNIPAEFSTLKGQFETAKNDIRKLQDLEVVVTPEKVLIRPVSDTTIASHLLIRFLFVALIVVISAVLFLIYWTVMRG